MFTIPHHKDIIGDLHLISKNYQELIGGENVIMYTGNNKYGNRILGVIVGEDEDLRILRYFNMILEYRQYEEFIHKRITLLELMREIGSFYAIDLDYNQNIKSFGIVQFDNLPKEYLPLKNSYCPTFAMDRTLDFGISLQGGEADLHRASIDDTKTVNNVIERAIETAFGSISEMNVEPEVFIQAYRVNGFRINLSVKLKKKTEQTSMFSETSFDTITNFVSSYVGYVISDLPNEQVEGNSESLNDLKNKLLNIYKESSYPVPAEVDYQLQDSLIHTVEELSPLKEKIGKNFNSIQVYNISKTSEQSIGLVSNEYFQKIETSQFLKKIDSTEQLKTLAAKEPKKSDDFPQPYKILVYAFSTKSGKGKIEILHSDDTADRTVSLEVVSSTIKKREFSGTKFTQSEHEKRYVNVKGVATRIGNSITKLVVDIDYDNL